MDIELQEFGEHNRETDQGDGETDFGEEDWEEE